MKQPGVQVHRGQETALSSAHEQLSCSGCRERWERVPVEMRPGDPVHRAQGTLTSALPTPPWQTSALWNPEGLIPITVHTTLHIKAWMSRNVRTISPDHPRRTQKDPITRSPQDTESRASRGQRASWGHHMPGYGACPLWGGVLEARGWQDELPSSPAWD